MSQLLSLSRTYPSRYGAPAIAWIDSTIFRIHYFTYCLECTFCHDWCCQFGVDVDLVHYRVIQRHSDALEAYTGIARGDWFTEEYEEDPGVPGGGSMRTAARRGACVFLNRSGRGCLLHAFAIERGIDYRELKSLVDCLFPLSFYDDVLCPADEVEEGSLVCVGTGPTLYRGLRDTLEYYFGKGFVRELDAMERAGGSNR
ncbi:MAG: hypothetical protein ACE5PT_11120 [Gemmatimonadales bacterium]